FRQDILGGGNCKTRILDMIERQVEAALDKFMAEDYGPASFAEMASQRLNLELETNDFLRLTYPDAQVVAREKATQMVPTRVFEMLDELLDPEADPKEWNYNGLADRANNLWDLKTNASALRKME